MGARGGRGGNGASGGSGSGGNGGHSIAILAASASHVTLIDSDPPNTLIAGPGGAAGCTSTSSGLPLNCSAQGLSTTEHYLNGSTNDSREAIATPSPTASSTAATPSSSSSTQVSTPTATPPSIIIPNDECGLLWWAACDQLLPGADLLAQPLASPAPTFTPGSSLVAPSAGLQRTPGKALVRPLPGIWCDGCSHVRDVVNADASTVRVCPRYGACQVGGVSGVSMRCAPGHTGAACRDRKSVV